MRRAKLIPERIWPLELGNWSFQRGLLADDSNKGESADNLSSERAPNNLPLRLLLVGLAIFIQGFDVIPFGWLEGLIGRPAAMLLSVLCMSLSLMSICLAVSPHLPGWLVKKGSRIIGRIVIIGCLGLAIIGLGEVVVIGYESFKTPTYYNDGALLDHNAALLLLHGQDPYTKSDIIAALRAFHQLARYTTPLQQGKLANQQDYPSPQELQNLFAQEPVGHPNQVLEFESHVSYPALAFLTLIPMVWAGVPTVIPFYALCLALLVFLGLRSVRPDLRWWVAVLFLADLPVINSTLTGDLDILYILLIFLAWITYKRWWLSAALLGLALASKQLAWYYLPFYLIFVYQHCGFKSAARRLALASVLFVGINLPFIVWNAGGWVAGVLAPVRDPMFPQGAGLIALSVGKLLPFLPKASYSVLEGWGMVATLIWYWKWTRKRPEAAMLLAVLPLFLAWRSLPSYFEFCALPTALLLAQGSGFSLTSVNAIIGKTPMRLYNISRPKEVFPQTAVSSLSTHSRRSGVPYIGTTEQLDVISRLALDTILPIPRFRRVKKVRDAINASPHRKI